jgi:predicted O-methyltransferase YrrM
MRWMRTRRNLRKGLLDFIKYLDLNEAEMVEIGCYAGESTSFFAKSGKFKKVYAVDPWLNGYDNKDYASYQVKMTKIEKIFDEKLADYDFVEKIKDYSVEASSKFEDASLDLVYIDGCHSYDAVISDIDSWLPKVKPGGYISGHDYFGKNKDRVTEVRKAVDERFASPDKTFQDNSWIVKVRE